MVPVPPNRGLIYDRRGPPLAENRPAFRLQLIPEKAGNLEDVFARLSELVDLPEDALERFENNRHRYRSFDGVQVNGFELRGVLSLLRLSEDSQIVSLQLLICQKV